MIGRGRSLDKSREVGAEVDAVVNIDTNTAVRLFEKENFEIIDNAHGHHLWFHVEGEPSGHVIAEIPETLDRKNIKYILKQGAVLCKQHSKFKSAKNVDIVYTRVDQIQKTDKIGSVLAQNTKIVTI